MKLSVIFITACLVLVSGMPVTADNEKVLISNVWIAEGPPVVKIHAGYLVIENRSNSDLILNSVHSPDFDRVEIHRSVQVDGLAKMQFQPSVTVPTHGKLVFEPGGYHLMLFEAVKPMLAGEQATLVFVFKDGSSVEATAEVKKMQHSEHMH